MLARRSPGVGHAAGRLGLIGGHVDLVAPSADALECTARREVAEETGVDLTGVPLRYLESAFFIADDGEPQITVAFVGVAPDRAQATTAAPDELSEVGWWTAAEAAADPACPAWLPDLLLRAGDVVTNGGQCV